MTVADINQSKLLKLNPVLAIRVRKIIDLAKSQNFDLQITQGLRTFAEQDALYAQGRIKPGARVTNARAGQSWHNFGLAADFCFIVGGKISWQELLYSKIGQWAAAANLEWGGNWRWIVDKPHVQLTNRVRIAVARALFQKGGLTAVWQSVEASEAK